MGTSITNGTTVSFSSTPQAKDDYFTSSTTGLTEDNLLALGWICLDVMANDAGGNAKTLYSIDNTNQTDEYGNPYAYDLLKSDVTSGVSLPEYTDFGAQIKIYNGKIYYNAATISGTHLSDLEALNDGQSLTDSFTYAIKLGNGAISWATVKVQIAGVTDASDTDADLSDDLAVTVSDELVNNAEKTAVAFTVAGLDADAEAD